MFMRKITSYAALALAALALPLTQRAQVTIAETENLQVYMTLDTVGMLQVLNNYDDHQATTANFYNTTPANLVSGIPLRNVTPGFQTAYGNMGFGGKFGSKQEIELYYELYLATWNHPTTTYGHEGYLLIHGMPEQAAALQFLNPIFKHVDLKVGMFEEEYGDSYLHRSFNGNVKRNPMIGNYVMDPNITSVGAEVRSKKDSPLIFIFNVNSGTTSENFYDGHGTAFLGKLGFQPQDGALKGLRVTGSFYRVNHAKSAGVGTQSGGAVTNMVSGNRSGARYEIVMNNVVGGVFKIQKDVTQYQLDVGFDHEKFGFYGNYGKVKDDDQNAAASWGNQNWWTPTGAGVNAVAPIKAREEWDYYALEGRYNFTKNFYAGARYSTARAKTLSSCNYNYSPTAVYNPANPAAQPTTPMGTCVLWAPGVTNANMNIDTSGHIDRIALGLGYQVGKHVRLKAELVQQQYKGFENGLNYNGLQAWRNPGYKGGLMEFAFWF